MMPSADLHTLPLSMLLFLVGTGAWAQKPPAPAPSPTGPTPTFRSDVELVTVDVVVATKKGQPVTGLKREDFVLREDGQPQAVTSFEAIELPTASAGRVAARPPVSSNTTREARTGRTFAVLFDDVHMDKAGGVRARQAISEFLKRNVADGDRILLAATSGRVWWSARMEAGREDLLVQLDRLDGTRVPDVSFRERITDYEALRISEFQDSLICQRVERRFVGENLVRARSEDEPVLANRCDPLVESNALEAHHRVLDRIRATAFTLERILDGMSLTPGRKAVLLVSPGFIHDPSTDPMKAATMAARRANAALYFVNLQGLQSADSRFNAEAATETDVRDLGAVYSEEMRGTEGADVLADDTGGFTVRNTNDLAGGLGRIADESRAYYLLGYVPANAARDDKFRKIAVEVSRKDVVVRARRGYFAGGGQAAARGGEMAPEVRMATDAPFEVAGIALRASSYVFEQKEPGKARVQLVADIDLRKLAFEEIDGRFVDAVDVLLTVTPRDAGTPHGFTDRIDMNLKPETRARHPWYPYSKVLELPAGRYQAKLVVREKNGGQVGSVIHDFEVGGLGGWRIATPVLTDVAPVDPKSGRPRPVPLARRELSNAGVLVVALEVFGAAREGGKGATRVAQGYTVLRDGREVKRVAPSTIRPSEDGRLVRLFGFGLAQMTPGDYEMVLDFVDEIDNRRQELREPFTVVAASEAQATN